VKYPFKLCSYTRKQRPPSYNHAYATTVTQPLSPVTGRRNAHACYSMVIFSGPFVSVSINLLRRLPNNVFGYLLGVHVCLITHCFVFPCAPRSKTKSGSDKSNVTKRKTIDLETELTNMKKQDSGKTASVIASNIGLCRSTIYNI
jgi:hypothetical protein